MTFKQVVEAFKKMLLIVLILSVTTFLGTVIYWTGLSMAKLWLVHPSVTLFTGSMVTFATSGTALFLTEILE